MTPLFAIGFNLAVNALFSFWGALLLVYLVLFVLRIGPGNGRFVLLALPLVKVIWDLVAGIPRNSFLWQNLAGARQELGSFLIGGGIERLGPQLQLMLSSHSHGLIYPQSAADLLYRALARHLSPALPGALLLLVLGVALAKVALRLASLTRFALETRRLLQDAELVDEIRLGRRRARIFRSAKYRGVPFAASALAPYVLFSTETFERLSSDERNAVIQHELAHLAHYDPVTILALTLASDLFWFVPGLGGLRARIFADLELRADTVAVQRGASRTALSSALVAVAEGLHAPPCTTAGLLRGGRLLRERVQRLLEQPASLPRPLYRHRLGKVFVILLTAILVLRSVFFGNLSS